MIWTLIFTTLVQAKTLFIPGYQAPTPIRLKQFMGVSVDENCLEKASSCHALQVIRDPSPPIEEVAVVRGYLRHPGAVLCHANLGKVVILSSKELYQYSFCLFKDGSYLDTMELHEKMRQKKRG